MANRPKDRKRGKRAARLVWPRGIAGLVGLAVATALAIPAAGVGAVVSSRDLNAAVFASAAVPAPIQVYARGSNGDLVEYVNDGLHGRIWNAYDITASCAGATIASAPDAFSNGTTMHVYAQGATGDLVEYVNDGLNGRIWNAYDITSVAGGSRLTIASTPDAHTFGGTIQVFAQGANGDLLQYVNDGLNGHIWNGYDVTTAAGGPRLPIASAPGALTYGTAVAVYAQGATGDLVEYTSDGVNGHLWNGYDITAVAGQPQRITGAVRVPGDVPASSFMPGFGGPRISIWAQGSNGDLIQYTNDGASGRVWNAYDFTTQNGSSPPSLAITSTPDVAMYVSPPPGCANAHLHIYARGTSGDLVEYVAGSSFKCADLPLWSGLITSDVSASNGGAPIASAPTVITYGAYGSSPSSPPFSPGTLHVYARGTNGDIVEYVNDGLNGHVWSTYDVSASIGGATITWAPDVLLDS